MLDKICQLARDAGDAIMQVYDGAQPMNVVSKADDSPVTAADIAAHGVIMKGLQALTPEIPVLSEEAPQSWDERQHWQRYWLVDPLDGTKEFIKRNGEFTVNIALIDKGKAVLGVVYAPVMKVMYSAAEGKARKEECGVRKPIRCAMRALRWWLSAARTATASWKSTCNSWVNIRRPRLAPR